MFAATLCAGAAARQGEPADLSLEELSNIVVTSVSRGPETLAAASASICVISADAIRRSGGSAAERSEFERAALLQMSRRY